MPDEIISISWSQAKTFRNCPKKWSYKYLDRLQAKEHKRAPYFGSWFHKCMETHYRNGDWRIGYKEYLKEYKGLFEEERAELDKKFGPLDKAVKRAVRSYLWYHRHEGWKILAVEQEFDFAIGSFKYKGVKVLVHANGIVDLIIEEEETGERWVIDHKSAGSIPEQSAFHAMDPQLMIYPEWARTVYGKISGIIYNYMKSRPPTIPQLTKKTGQISKRKIVTDYPTAKQFLIDNGYDPADFSDFLRPLRRSSPLLKRYKLPREKRVTEQIIKDFIATAKDIYIERRKTNHVRNITKDCRTMCEFHDLCRGELNGLDMSYLRKSRYTLREKKVEQDGVDADEELGEDEEEEETEE